LGVPSLFLGTTLYGMADRTFLTMVALGADRPGLLRLVSRYIATRGGNVEDSRMVALGGVVGLMLLLSTAPDGAARILADVKELERESAMRIMIESARDPSDQGVRAPGALWTVRASAVDREGLLADIADAVRDVGANVVELDSSTAPGLRGEPVFQLRMVVAMRTAGDVGRMKDALMAIAFEARIELEIRPAERTQTKAAGLTLLP
jgi:glycine cleavage system regulatory protein